MRAAVLLLLLCAAAVPAGAAGLADYAGFWSGELAGFRGGYKVTLTVSGMNRAYYGSYSVSPPEGKPARGSFTFEPGKEGCWSVKLNCGGLPRRVPEFCPRPGGGVTFFVDGLDLSVIAEMKPGRYSLDAIVSGRGDELRGTLARRTPYKPAPEKAAPPEPSVKPLNEKEKALRSKRPPKP